MNTIHLLLSFLAGIFAGGLYFGGLWYTVRQLSTARQPALLLLGSFALRLALLLGAIYLLASVHWSNLFSAMAGVLLARTLLIRRWGPGDGEQSTINEERRTVNDER
jgi:F1F0 ATPase subunit 2